METNLTRKTRSMKGNMVANHFSKEFLFSDPERKFKKLDTDPKIRFETHTSNVSAGGSGSKKTSDTTENLLISGGGK